MKLNYGLPCFNEDNHKELLKNDWKQLKEPKSIGIKVILSIPFMILNYIVSQSIVGLFLSETITFHISGISGLFHALFVVILMIIVITLLHELVHLVFVPNFLHSDKTSIGFTFFIGYVYTEEILSKTRMLIICIAPFIVFSVICSYILGYLGLYNIVTLLFILLNSIGSSADILDAVLILFQVPRKAKVVSNGFRTYFKQ